MAAVLIAACGAATSTGGPAAPPPGGTAVEPTEAVYQVVAEACGTGPEGVATGVAVAERHIVTVAHTFDRAASVAVVAGGDDEPREVELVWLDGERDLAVLELSDGPARWLPLGSAAPGQAVTVLSAGGPGVEAKAAEVLRLVDVTLDGAGGRAGLELEARIDPGDSGAPVVSESGEVVGLVFATERDDTRAWAIAAADIEAALADSRPGPIGLSC